MELRQLKYFVATARLLNFSEASRRLFVTQGTLSQQIGQLEDELGIQLFTRTSHKVFLTEAGSELLPLAEKTLEDAKCCSERLSDLTKMNCGTLNIGVTYSFETLLAETLKSFIAVYPGIRVNVFYKTANELIQMLRHREIDFAVAFRPSQMPEEVDAEVLFDVPLSVIMHHDHPLAEKDILCLDDLRKWGLALPAKGLQARIALDKVIENTTVQSGIPRSKIFGLPVRVELNDPNIILELVSGGKMITILSEYALQCRPGLVARPLEGMERTMRGAVLTLREGYVKHSASVFLEMLRESAALSRI